MQLKESITRGFNLLAVTLPALVGLAFSSEAVVETDMIDKLDDGLLFLLGIAAVWWYVRGTNRFKRSVVPVVLVLLGLLIKLGGFIIEMGDPEAFGDDVGGVIFFIAASALVLYQWNKTKKMLAADEHPAAGTS